MKKDRSNQSSSSGRSLTLPKNRILRGRANFQRLFDNQKAVVFHASHLNVRFCVFSDNAQDCKMGFIVPKKLGNAVHRNKVKRLLREAYRMNQHVLTDLTAGGTISFHGALMAKTITVDFSAVRAEVVDLLDNIQAYMHSTFKL